MHRYPSLDLISVYEVLAYVLRHRKAVDQYLEQREATQERVRTELEATFPQDRIRACLLARWESTRGAP